MGLQQIGSMRHAVQRNDWLPACCRTFPEHFYICLCFDESEEVIATWQKSYLGKQQHYNERIGRFVFVVLRSQELGITKLGY